MKENRGKLKRFNHAIYFFGCIFLLCAVCSPVIFSQEEVSENEQEIEDAAIEEAATETFTSADLPEADLDTTDKISLDLKGVDIIELFRILSLKTGLTIVPSKNVKGRINVFLNNISFEDALDIILITQDLASVKKDNIIYVLTGAEYKATYGRDYIENREYTSIKLKYAAPANVSKVVNELKSGIGKVIVDDASGVIILIDTPEKLTIMENAIRQLDVPLETEIFSLNYADTEAVQSKLSDMVTSGTGTVIVDERASKVIVSDLSSKMDKIRDVVANLDEPDKQVFLEVEIVQVTLTDKFYRGIDWEKVFGTKHADDLDLKVDFSITPAPSEYGQMSIGTFATDRYNIVLQFLNTYGDVKILSRPRIAVVNNEEAKILVGKRDAYITSTQSQAETTTITSESIEFIDVGVKLNVVPTINKDGFVTIKIKPEVSSVSETLTSSLGARVPIVETSEAETVVKVKDGAMIMIAGLLKEEKKDEQSGIPGLSQLPFIGGLFGSRTKQKNITELIIFIAPHIITGESPVEDTSPQDMIPEDIMPEDIRRDIIRKEIEKIQPLREQSQETIEKKEDIQERVKGLKAY